MQMGRDGFMKRKTIWILNHYANTPNSNGGTRHFDLSKELTKQNYNVVVFASGFSHSELKDKKSYIDKTFEIENFDELQFVWLKTFPYKSNNWRRIVSMFSYVLRVLVISSKFSKPDVILGSSVHPLAVVAAWVLSIKYNTRFVFEIRDLWPESFRAYNVLGKTSFWFNLMYAGENWLYKKADKIIFTMEGGQDYIIDKRWNVENGGNIDLSKIYHINNGIDLETFEFNKQNQSFFDEDLDDETSFRVVYTGSIRRANYLNILLDAAAILKQHQIKFLIFGEGDYLEGLKDRIVLDNLSNVKYKGKVAKSFIPSILSKSDLNIVPGRENAITKYGMSLNKMFEYFASGKPVLATYKSSYSLVQKYKAGRELETANAVSIADEILRFKNMSKEEYLKYCENALVAAQDYDLKNLAKKLESVLFD